MNKDGRRARKQQISSQAWDLRVSERGSSRPVEGRPRPGEAGGASGAHGPGSWSAAQAQSTPKSTPVRKKNPTGRGVLERIWFAQESPAMELAQTHGEQIDGRMTRSKETDTAEDNYKWSRQGDSQAAACRVMGRDLCTGLTESSSSSRFQFWPHCPGCTEVP